ncbi:NUDIX hydrolase [Sorangium sp. So ce131]|uniref:NUDIX hydrolase n=1 Tax=Sorangium sp. So ce131 TaxID=3133282 RepID=UPI003F5F2387
MAIGRWKALERRVHQHSPWRRIEDVLFELPDGKVRTFSLKKEGRVVSILAITPERRVVLARQYRPGPDRILDELPAGGVEPGEAPEEAAARELLEETGYVARDLLPLGRPLECAYSTIERHAFLAVDCVRKQAQALDETEFIEVLEKPIEDFIAQLREGACTDPEVGWMGLYALGCLKVHA